MNSFIKVVIAWPVLLGVILGLVHWSIHEWQFAGPLVWIVYLGLSFGVWFPFILMPYLRKTATRK